MTRALRVAAAQIVYMPTLAPTSTSVSPGAKVPIHSRVHGSLVRMVSTRMRVVTDGVQKRIRMPSWSTTQAGTNFSYCSSVIWGVDTGQLHHETGAADL